MYATADRQHHGLSAYRTAALNLRVHSISVFPVRNIQGTANSRSTTLIHRLDCVCDFQESAEKLALSATLPASGALCALKPAKPKCRGQNYSVR